MRVLIVGYADSIFIKDYIENVIKAYGHDAVVCSVNEKTGPFSDYYSHNHIPVICIRNLRRAFGKLPSIAWKLVKGILKAKVKKIGPFDAVHIHFVTPWALELASTVKEVYPHTKIVCSFHGSDIFRADQKQLHGVEGRLSFCDRITVLTAAMKEDLLKQYPALTDDRVSAIRFGNPNLPFITELQDHTTKKAAKQQLGVDEDKLLLVCGYKSGPPLRHLESLSQFGCFSEDIKKKLYILIPLTYGGTEEYNQSVLKALQDSGIDGRTITNRMSDTDISLLRIATDIYTNIQTTDAISASMIEHLYCQAVVINGEWLDYRELEQNGVFYLKVKKPDDLGQTVVDVIKDISTYQQQSDNNASLIRQMCSWESQGTLWNGLY